MGKPKGPQNFFSHVKAAREVFISKAKEWVEDYDKVIKGAIEDGNHDVASRSIQWGLAHMPAEDGVTVVEIGVDQPKQVEVGSGPKIQIGIAFGGLAPMKELPPAVEVKNERSTKESPASRGIIEGDVSSEGNGRH